VYPEDYCLTYEGMTVIMEDTAILAAVTVIIDIGNEIIANSTPDDLIPLFPSFDYVLIEFQLQSDISSLLHGSPVNTGLSCSPKVT